MNMRKFIATILLVFVLVPVIVLSLTLMVAGPWVTGPQRLATVFTGQRVEAILRTAVLQEADLHVADSPSDLGLRLDSTAALKALVEVLPQGLLAAFWDEALQKTYGAFESAEPPVPVSISVVPIKNAVISNSDELIDLYLSYIPIDENLSLGDFLENPDFRVKSGDKRFDALARKELKKALEVLPNTITYSLEDLGGEDIGPVRDQYISIKQAITGTTIGLGIFAGLLLVATAFLAGKEPGTRFGFLGLGLAIPSLPLAGIGAVLMIAGRNLPAIMADADIQLSLGSASLEAGLTDMIRDFCNLLGADFFMVGAVVLAIGLGFIITRHFMTRRSFSD